MHVALYDLISTIAIDRDNFFPSSCPKIPPTRAIEILDQECLLCNVTGVQIESIGSRVHNISMVRAHTAEFKFSYLHIVRDKM